MKYIEISKQNDLISRKKLISLDEINFTKYE